MTGNRSSQGLCRARRVGYLLLLAGCVIPSLSHADTPPTSAVWVFFRDHGESAGVLERPAAIMSPRARQRLATRAPHSDPAFAVHEPYVRDIAERVTRIRTVSRWFNAVSVDVTPEQRTAVRALPEVLRTADVRNYNLPAPELEGTTGHFARQAIDTTGQQRYGASYWQYNRVGIPALHARGLTGAGVRICVIDAGFTRFDHPVFSQLTTVLAKDFITGSSSLTQDSHGAQVLSVIAGYNPGAMVGPAYRSEYMLARTEARLVEMRAEEDLWIAAAEWADSAGADIITSSLGYNTFDDPTEDHSLADLNGTSLLTQAADLAVSRGIVVVVSAGNERGAGGSPGWQGRITLPADGFGVIAVGSLTADDDIASSSSVGPTADGRVKPDIAAPGDNVVALDVAMTSGYTRVSGTSFAAPVVAGAAALLLEKNPAWTPRDVKNALLWSAEDILAPGPDNFSGWGVMNADLALEEIIHSGIVGRVVTPVRDNLGTVKDVPVAGVRVRLRTIGSGSSIGETASDVRGRFFFDNQSDGAYAIQLQHPAYTDTQVAVSIPQATQISIRLAANDQPASAPYRLVPNPANGTSGVTISGAAHPDLAAKFYDISGALVRELGPQQMYWDLTTNAGRPVAGGIYICRIEIAGSEVWRGKLAVLR